MGQSFMVFFKHTLFAGIHSVLNGSFYEVKHKINEKDQLGKQSHPWTITRDARA